MDGATEEPGLQSRRGISDAEFETLYTAQVARIYGFLARRIGAAFAEDLTAQVFLEAWAGRDRYDEDQGGSVGWLFGIATNLLRRHHRKEATQLRAFARVGVDPTDTFDEDAVVDRIMVRDGWKRVAAALSDLSDVDRDILTLAGWAKLSYDDIASALELPIGTVKSRLSRARTQLARRLASAIDLT